MGKYLRVSLKLLILAWLGTEWMWVEGPSQSSEQPVAENNADVNCPFSFLKAAASCFVGLLGKAGTHQPGCGPWSWPGDHPTRSERMQVKPKKECPHPFSFSCTLSCSSSSRNCLLMHLSSLIQRLEVWEDERKEPP